MGESKIDMSTDEVMIISGVLELREKKPKNIMTPFDKVFMISEDAELNDELILSVRNCAVGVFLSYLIL
jgi:CBS domain containing-hemolysin-like protein